MSKSFENKLRLFVYELIKRYGGQPNAKFTMTALLGSFGLKTSFVRLEDMKKHGILVNFVRESGTANRGVHYLYTVNATVDEKAIEAFILETDRRNKQNSKEYRQVKKKRKLQKQRADARKKHHAAVIAAAPNAVVPNAQQIRFSEAIKLFDPAIQNEYKQLVHLRDLVLSANGTVSGLLDACNYAERTFKHVQVRVRS